MTGWWRGHRPLERQYSDKRSSVIPILTVVGRCQLTQKTRYFLLSNNYEKKTSNFAFVEELTRSYKKIKNRTPGSEAHLVMADRTVSRLGFDRYPLVFLYKVWSTSGCGINWSSRINWSTPTVERKWTRLIQILCIDKKMDTLCSFPPQFHPTNNNTQSGRKFW